MSSLTPEVDAADVGFDADRLTRIDAHFARYVDDGKLPGWLLAVTRHGKLAHVARYGRRDMENDLPIEDDTVFRIYSMSKPITSVAAMMLYEQGGFELKDQVSRFIPSFADVRVFAGGTAEAPETAPATEPVRMWHLLTHTAGLTYGFHRAHVTDEIYRNHGFDFSSPRGADLEAVCDLLAGLPLVHQPGARWNYSHATDVLGRVVEVLSGLPLDQYLRDNIFEPLAMHDTAFWADGDKADRLAALYVPTPGTLQALRYDPIGHAAHKPPRFFGGGGGLVSTAPDYLRFVEMLRGGGQVDGVRLLSNRTVDFMTTNHLPGGLDLEQFGQSGFAETAFDGTGFGLGFSVVLDPAGSKTLASVGDFAWGGAASTGFWVDPVEDITAVFFTQLLPSSTYNIRPQFKQLVKQALVS